jgi:hypothetical protein
MGSTDSLDIGIGVEMIFESWQEWDFMYWDEGLGILTLPWIRPFLPMMEVPSKLSAKPELWAELYKQTRVQYSSIGNLFTNQQIAEQKCLILKSAFEDLLLRSDLETVNGLCRWFHRHFRSENFSRAIHQWQFVLVKVIWPPDQLPCPINYPTFFEPLIAELSELVYYEHERIRIALLQMPTTFLVPAEDPDLIRMRRMLLVREQENGNTGDSEGNPIGDASIVYTVIAKELMIKAIKLINYHPEQKQLMAWLYEVSKTLGTYELEFSDVEVLRLYDGLLD